MHATEHKTEQQISVISEYNRRLLQSPLHLPPPSSPVQQSAKPTMQHGASLIPFNQLDQEQVENSVTSLSDDVNDWSTSYFLPTPVQLNPTERDVHQPDSACGNQPTPAVHPITPRHPVPPLTSSSAHPLLTCSNRHTAAHHIPPLPCGNKHHTAIPPLQHVTPPSVALGVNRISELINRTQILANVIGRLQKTTEKNIRLEKCRERRLRNQIYKI